MLLNLFAWAKSPSTTTKTSSPPGNYVTIRRKTVIPDERRFAGRDPESSECSMTSFGVWFPAFAGTLSGSRLASAAGGLGRDD
jgi:hypothetical protein